MIVAGNWKMHGSKAMISDLITGINSSIGDNSCIVFPPSIYIQYVSELLGQCSNIKLGIQNCYPNEAGAYTGEIAASMAKEFSCGYVLVGHSERRTLFKESDDFVAKKFHHVKENGMIPVLCVGETLEEREQGLTQQVIQRQLEAVMNTGPLDSAIIAYEPVWAIGTGQTASPEQAQQVHEFIRELLAPLNLAQTMPILYGGSVNEKNAEALFAMPDIDGGLVGGASLNVNKFLEIVKCIK
jgi:triosephosphate isomerase